MSTTYPCWHCGQLVPDYRRACPHCGALQSGVTTPASTKTVVWIVLGIVGVAMLVGGIAVYQAISTCVM